VTPDYMLDKVNRIEKWVNVRIIWYVLTVFAFLVTFNLAVGRVTGMIFESAEMDVSVFLLISVLVSFYGGDKLMTWLGVDEEHRKQERIIKVLNYALVKRMQIIETINKHRELFENAGEKAFRATHGRPQKEGCSDERPGSSPSLN